MFGSQLNKLERKPITLDTLCIDVVHHLLEYINVLQFAMLQQISSMFDEAVQSRCRRHYNEYSLCSKSVNQQLPTLSQIKCIFSAIGPHVEKLTIHYDTFSTKLQLPISKIIRDHCSRLQSLDVCHNKNKNNTIAVPNLSKLKTLKLSNCADDEYIGNYLIKCPELQSLTLISNHTENITGRCLMAVCKLKELTLETGDINNETIWQYFEANNNILKLKLQILNQEHTVDIAKLNSLLPNIQDLTIRHCTTPIESNAFHHLQHLSLNAEHNVNGNNIAELLNVLVKHDKIISLEFLFCNLSNQEKILLGQFSKLEQLILNATSFDPHLLDCLSTLPTLNSLKYVINGEMKTIGFSTALVNLEHYTKLKHLKELVLFFPWQFNLINVHELANIQTLLQLQLITYNVRHEELILLVSGLAQRNILESIVIYGKVSVSSELFDKLKLMYNLKNIQLLGEVSVETSLLNSFRNLAKLNIATVKYSSYRVNKIEEFLVCNNKNWRTVCQQK